MATTKRTPAPGDADKLIVHQARLLKAPRIATHYSRLAEQGRAANWSLEDYLGAVLAVESNARAESGAHQRIRYAGFPAIKTITDFDFTAQPAVDRAQIARLAEAHRIDRLDACLRHPHRWPRGLTGPEDQGGARTCPRRRDHPSGPQRHLRPGHRAQRNRRLGQVEDMILSLYARGMSTRDITEHLAEVYGATVSAATVSRVTEVVTDEIAAWQSRPVDPVYPILYIDAIRIKIRDGGMVANKAAHVVIGVDVDGIKQVLGVWIQQTEGATFWHGVLTELRNRGCRDALFVCCDGLTGLPEPIASVWPAAIIQTCVVHLLRASMRYASYTDRKKMAAALRPIYTAATEEATPTPHRPTSSFRWPDVEHPAKSLTGTGWPHSATYTPANPRSPISVGAQCALTDPASSTSRPTIGSQAVSDSAGRYQRRVIPVMAHPASKLTWRAVGDPNVIAD